MTIQTIIDTYKEQVNLAATTYRLRDSLIYAVIVQESSGNFGAVSNCGARGLMQLTPIALLDFNRLFHKEYVFAEMFNPDANIDAGSGFLSHVIQQLGDETLGIRAYNQGAGRVKKNPDAGKWYSDGVLAHEKSIIEILNPE